jgi:cell wall assembly regulator SMI1
MNTSAFERIVHELVQELDGLFANQNPPYGAKVEWCETGLDSDSIRQHEMRLGISVPNEHKAALLAFDGILVDCPIESAETRPGLPEGHVLISQIQFLREWNDEASIQFQRDINSVWSDTYENDQIRVIGPAKQLGHHEKWIMCGYTQYGQLYLDFAPAPGGKMGQLLAVETDDEGPFVHVLAADFISFLRITADSLQRKMN